MQSQCPNKRESGGGEMITHTQRRRKHEDGAERQLKALTFGVMWP